MKARDYKIMVQAILGFLNEGVHVIDQHETTIFYNERMAELEKMNCRDVLNKPFRSVFRNIEEERSTLLKALREGRPSPERRQTYRNRTGQEISTLNRTFPIYDGENIIGAVEVAQDVTHIRKMSETLLKWQGQAEESKKGEEAEGICRQRREPCRFDQILGIDGAFREVVERARKAGQTHSTILVSGETGTGKEMVAQSIHYDGSRQKRPFVAQNCAALPESLLESILFGTARGGFTGAVDQAGLFEQAHQGTLLLDEISAMPYGLQGKLLRVLQENYIRRVGGTRDIPVDVRIIATINEPAEELLAQERMRRDLYYRLNVIRIDLPPLRERPDDILYLADYFLERFSRQFNRASAIRLADAARARLIAYSWPGNVRELENAMLSAVALAGGAVVRAEQLMLPDEAERNKRHLPRMDALALPRYFRTMERDFIAAALAEQGGNITRAARQLGISRQTLQYKLKIGRKTDDE